jgi:2-polyprenyl-6-methoxyphenol hydroxylase-like FAD-dependent oxidoreductase
MVQSLSTTCTIVGGGPAGMMTGYLLARAGVDVVVLERHADFFRDFRGDTIHPSTMQVMFELGLLEEFLRVPHQVVKYAEVELGGERLRVADFTHLPTRCQFIAFMPQWDFLNFLAARARGFAGFHLIMEGEARALLRDNGRVTGVRASTPTGDLEIRAHLVIGADGRHSTLRENAGFQARDIGAPMDVLWFRLSHRERETQAVLGRVDVGQALVMLDRRDYWQCALLIAKGTFDSVKARGLEAFRTRVARLAGRDDASEIREWDDVKLLSVKVDRLDCWHQPGLLFIGDAAHAMSPIGGVGINLAIQDGVAAANILTAPLKRGNVTADDLAKVRRRRWLPTCATQAMQVAIQNKVIYPVLHSERAPAVPSVLKLARRWPVLQRLPARLIGIGVRPEHVRASARGDDGRLRSS